MRKLLFFFYSYDGRHRYVAIGNSVFWKTYCGEKKHLVAYLCNHYIMHHRGDYVMERLKKFIKRYRFFLLLVLINGLLFMFKPELGRETAALSFRNLLEMLSVIPPIFLLLGLMDVWVPRETMMKYMGKDAGIKGGIFAFVLGSFSAGPLYASFPVAAVFLKKGVLLTNVFLFIGLSARGRQQRFL